MIESYFHGCEDPEFVDIELELPQDEFGMFEGDGDLGDLPDLALDFGEFNELGGLQEEFESKFLEGMPIDEGIEVISTGDEMPMIEEFEPDLPGDAGPSNLAALIEIIKKHPGLKITISY